MNRLAWLLVMALVLLPTSGCSMLGFGDDDDEDAGHGADNPAVRAARTELQPCAVECGPRGSQNACVHAHGGTSRAQATE